MNSLVLNKNQVLVRLIFIAITIKLIISPWATGDFQMPAGQVLNYVCDGGLLLAVVLGAFSVQRHYLYIYLAAVVSGLTYALSTLLFTEQSPLAMMSTHLKIYLPLLAFPLLLKSYHQDRETFIKYVKYLILLVGFLLVLGLAILPSSLNRLDVWWPSYFSGLHSTAYAALMLMFLIYALYQHDEMKLPGAIFAVFILSLCIYFGWGVRTAMLSFVVFILGIVSCVYHFNGRPLIQYALLIFPTVLVVVLPFLDFGDGLNSFSSGRLSMYVEKYDQLMTNSLFQWVLGNGFGSDLIETDVWWWAAKGAHSDLITMFVEGGLIYFLLFLWVVFRLLKEGGGQHKSMLLAVFMTAIVSNGVFVRPVAGYLLAITLVLFVEIKRFNRVSS